jgi:formate-dependent nitrite reductase membrane component NrfD
METIIMTLLSPLLLPVILAAAFAIMTGQKPQAFIKPLVNIYFSILRMLFGLLLTSIKLLWSKRYNGYLDHREPFFEEQKFQSEQHNSNIRIKVLDN